MTGREGWWSRSRNLLFISGQKNAGAIYLQFYLLCNIVNNYVTVGKRLITEGFNAADNSSIVPVILPIALDKCQNSVVGEAAGGTTG